MKRLIFIYFLFSPVFPMEHINEAHLVMTIVQEQTQQIDQIAQENNQEVDRPSNCPSGSSTKVKIALISASASLLSAIIYLIIHLTK